MPSFPRALCKVFELIRFYLCTFSPISDEAWVGETACLTTAVLAIVQRRLKIENSKKAGGFNPIRGQTHSHPLPSPLSAPTKADSKILQNWKESITFKFTCAEGEWIESDSLESNLSRYSGSIGNHRHPGAQHCTVDSVSFYTFFSELETRRAQRCDGTVEALLSPCVRRRDALCV